MNANTQYAKLQIKVMRRAQLVLLLLFMGLQVITLSPLHAANDLSNNSSTDSQSLVIENTVNFDAAHNQLSHIITSDAYAELTERKVLQRIKKEENEPDSKLIQIIEDFLRFLFDRDGSQQNDSTWELMPVLIKVALVVALLVFIAWIIKKADSQHWFATLRRPLGKKVSVSALTNKPLPQSWETLPPHPQIAAAVNEIIDQQQYDRAASMLYRASLRWLKHTYAIPIKPATTEKQCLAQINQITGLAPALIGTPMASNADAGNQSIATLNPQAADYVAAIIQCWMTIAYAQHSVSQSDNVRYAKTLRDLTEHWLDALPLNDQQGVVSFAAKSAADQITQVSTVSGESL